MGKIFYMPGLDNNLYH